MADDPRPTHIPHTIVTLTDDELWTAAYDRAVELVGLLHPDKRGQAVLGLPYWMLVGMNVGAVTAATNELSKRGVQR